MTGGIRKSARRPLVPDINLMESIARWKAEKPVNQLLPIQFADGTRLDHLEIDCGGCNRVLRAKHQRAVISMLTADAYRLDGLAACEQCRTFTRFSILCSGAGGVVTIEFSTASGREMRIQVHATWFKRLAAWLTRRL